MRGELTMRAFCGAVTGTLMMSIRNSDVVVSESDTPRAHPVFYRAVYVDPATGIPYAKLVRDPVE